MTSQNEARRRRGLFLAGDGMQAEERALRDLLPTDVAPVTTAITAVEHGPRERATVRFEDGRKEEIAIGDSRLYVSEEENPGNRKRVRVVKIELPAPLLASGMRLVDTPGGSASSSTSPTGSASRPA